MNEAITHQFRAPSEVVMGQHDSSLGLVGTGGVQQVVTMTVQNQFSIIVQNLVYSTSF